MRVLLDNRSIFTDASVRELATFVLHTKSPYRKRTSGWRMKLIVTTGNPPPKTQVFATCTRDTAVLGGPYKYTAVLCLSSAGFLQHELVNALRWIGMVGADVAANDWPDGAVAEWPAPGWIGQAPALELAPPVPIVVRDPAVVAREQEELKAWARNQRIKAAQLELKRANTRAKRAATSVKFWEKRLRTLHREVARADRRFLKTLDTKQQASMVEEAERAITQAMADLEDE